MTRKPKKRMGRPPKVGARNAAKLTIRLSADEQTRLNTLRGDREAVDYIRQKALA